MIAATPDDMLGLRDRALLLIGWAGALLLIGWAGALRLSELVALEVADLRFEEEGLLIKLRRSKTDQDAAGDSVAIALGVVEETCPVVALRR